MIFAKSSRQDKTKSCTNYNYLAKHPVYSDIFMGMYTEMVSVYISSLSLVNAGPYEWVSNSSHTLSHIFHQFFDNLHCITNFMMKTLEMLMKQLLIALSLVCAATSANAVNVYKPNTDGDKLYAKVIPYLPDEIVVIFINQDDPRPLLDDLDIEAFPKAGLSASDTLGHYIEAMADEAPFSKNRLSYALVGADVPGNRPEIKSCAIVLMNKEIFDKEELLSHEALHCRNSQVRDTQAFVEAVSSLWKEQSFGMSQEEFSGFIDEAMVSGMQVAYAAKLGSAKVPYFVGLFANLPNEPGNSMGRRTAKNLIAICSQKPACPTDSSGMLHMILGDQKIRADLLKDIAEIRRPAGRN